MSFCKGKCEKCGLAYEILMLNNLTNKTETVKKCAFHHMADSYIRLEERLIGIQAAIEDSRNEKADADNKLSSILGIGLTGMMHAFNEDKTKFENAMKLLAGKEVKNVTIPDRIS